MRTQYPGWCSECRQPVPAGEGHLAGRDDDTGRWRVVCETCHPYTEPDTAYRPDPTAAWSPPQGWPADDPILRRLDQQRRERTERLRRDQPPPPPWTPPTPTCLRVLGLVPPVGPDQVKQRYRALAQQHHPDHGGDARRFVELAGAYEQAMALVGGGRRS